MPIDLEKAIGAELAGGAAVWDEDDIILYHLGVGAGVPPTDPGELRYAYEGDLRVLPTYATIPQFPVMMSMGHAPGFDINPAMILHGEHEIVVHEPIPTTGTVIQTGSVIEILDKGKGALVIVEIVSVLEKTGKPLFTNRASIFIRGEGGFGGDSGPSTTDLRPSRDPDDVVESVTLPQQALLYRMASRDKNPLHADPGFAAFAGFDRPILHGLCTYGMVCKAVVDHALDGRPDAVASFRARFSGVVYPGETLVSSVWDDGEVLVVSTSVKEREVLVLSNGVVSRRS
ncbi:MAG TPA: MaoC/PaaZ C-terminal domain-containing protein [Acidimicrobiia bacterium]|jgi:acyl dehydratase|nr:3-alpha,7-alpha, 12-alpha-trihydroxy-5-beta-cholest-24-enoyl-CoA hydratase [Acidimicrobiia bacterium]HYJ24725.1 MaoC/PaaZ C-terminal domain-containing protein [Acidimicrobiia bacterium]